MHLPSRLMGIGSIGLFVAIAGSGACGGNVVIDPARATTASSASSGAGGAQGAGGANGVGAAGTGGVSPTLVGPTVTSGPGNTTIASTGSGTNCSCREICSNARACLPRGACESICHQASAEQLACACSAGSSCSQLESCIGGSAVTTGVGGTSGATGGTGGSSTGNQCSQCEVAAATSSCDMSYQACQADSACQSIVSCHMQCGYTQACATQCESTQPMASVALYLSLAECVVCKVCAAPCANDVAYHTYCLPQGG